MKKLKRKFHKVLQGSEEWHELRRGRATSSNFDKIFANYGKAFGNPAHEYAQKKALERVTGTVDLANGFKNSYMDRGNELEPIARELYELETFYTVEDGGFFSLGEAYGDSPDGLVGSDGCIEIKCVIPNTHWKRIKSQDFDKSYKGQIQGHLLITGRKWCDFISYCPEFPKGKQLFIKRVHVDEDYRAKLKERLIQFEELVQEYVEMIKAA